MSKFAFNSISDALLMQSLNGQNHGLYVWSVLAIVFFTLLITFLVYRDKLKKVSKKIK